MSLGSSSGFRARNAELERLERERAAELESVRKARELARTENNLNSRRSVKAEYEELLNRKRMESQTIYREISASRAVPRQVDLILSSTTQSPMLSTESLTDSQTSIPEVLASSSSELRDSSESISSQTTIPPRPESSSTSDSQRSANLAKSYQEQYEAALQEALRPLELEKRLERRRRADQDHKWEERKRRGEPGPDEAEMERIRQDRAKVDEMWALKEKDIAREVTKNYQLKLALTMSGGAKSSASKLVQPSNVGAISGKLQVVDDKKTPVKPSLSSSSEQRLEKSADDISTGRDTSENDLRSQSSPLLNESSTYSPPEENDDSGDEDTRDSHLSLITVPTDEKLGGDAGSAETTSALSTADQSSLSAPLTQSHRTSGDWADYTPPIRKNSTGSTGKPVILVYETVPLSSGEDISPTTPRLLRRKGRGGESSADGDGEDHEDEGGAATGEDDYDYEYISEGDEGRLSSAHPELLSPDASSIFTKDERSEAESHRPGIIVTDTESVLSADPGPTDSAGAPVSSNSPTETLRVVKVYMNNVREYKTQFLKPTTTVGQILVNLTKTMNLGLEQKAKYELFEMTEAEGLIRAVAPNEIVLQIVEKWPQRPYETLLVARVPDELDKVSLPYVEGIVRRINRRSPTRVGHARFLRTEATRVSFLKPSHVVSMEPAMIAAVGASIASGASSQGPVTGSSSSQANTSKISSPATSGGENMISGPTGLSPSTAATAAALVTGANGDILTVDFVKVTQVRHVESGAYDDSPYIRDRAFEIVIGDDVVTLLADAPEDKNKMVEKLEELRKEVQNLPAELQQRGSIVSRRYNSYFATQRSNSKRSAAGLRPKKGRHINDFSEDDFAVVREIVHNSFLSIIEDLRIMPVSEVIVLLRQKKASSMRKFLKGLGDKKKASSDLTVFGTSLETLVERMEFMSGEMIATNKPIPVRIPPVISDTLMWLTENGLKTSGIFRVSGSARRIEALKKTWNTTANPSITIYKDAAVYDVASLLKQFFRDLPDPLLTFRLFTPFIRCDRIPNEDTKFRALQLLLYLLPVPHRHVTEVLLEFLSKVAENAGDMAAAAAQCAADTEVKGDKDVAAVAAKAGGNLMDAGNLATVIGPNILREKSSDPGNINTAVKELEYSTAISNIVKLLIERNKSVWFIPTDIEEEIKATLDADRMLNARKVKKGSNARRPGKGKSDTL